MLEPEQVLDDWLRDEEWNREKMRPLQKATEGVSSTLCLSLRSSAPPSPIGVRKQQFTPDIPYGSSFIGNEYGKKYFFNFINYLLFLI